MDESDWYCTPTIENNYYRSLWADSLGTSIALYHVCTLRADLSTIPRSKFIKKTNSAGTQYYEVHYKLRMSLASEVRVYLKGESVLVPNLPVSTGFEVRAAFRGQAPRRGHGAIRVMQTLVRATSFRGNKNEV
jgi:hypothetical protein